MKAYITKYVLTQGILEQEVEEIPYMSNMVKTTAFFPSFYHKPFWHLTMEEAIKHANFLKEKEINSLEKKLAKIKSLTF